MPRLRLLPNGFPAPGTQCSGVDPNGNLIFDVGAGDTALVRIDATAFVGGDAITLSEWEAPDGAIIDGGATSGSAVSTLATIPTDSDGRAFAVRNTLTLDTGVIRKTTVLLRAMVR